MAQALGEQRGAPERKSGAGREMRPGRKGRAWRPPTGTVSSLLAAGEVGLQLRFEWGEAREGMGGWCAGGRGVGRARMTQASGQRQ